MRNPHTLFGNFVFSTVDRGFTSICKFMDDSVPILVSNVTSFNYRYIRLRETKKEIIITFGLETTPYKVYEIRMWIVILLVHTVGDNKCVCHRGR